MQAVTFTKQLAAIAAAAAVAAATATAVPTATAAATAAPTAAAAAAAAATAAAPTAAAAAAATAAAIAAAAIAAAAAAAAAAARTVSQMSFRQAFPLIPAMTHIGQLFFVAVRLMFGARLRQVWVCPQNQIWSDMHTSSPHSNCCTCSHGSAAGRGAQEKGCAVLPHVLPES